jgi:hypothetical protein
MYPYILSDETFVLYNVKVKVIPMKCLGGGITPNP